MSTTFVVDADAAFSAEAMGDETRWVYTRWGNPTVHQLELKLAALEGADTAVAFGSGMAALFALLVHTLKSGDHAVISDVAYADFQAFTAANPDARVAETDSVIGRVGGKVLLTLLFRDCGLMLAFLRDRNDSQSVIDAFALLWREAGPELFRRLFPVLLTDNGSEFSTPPALESAPDGSPRSRLFDCDPCASWRKGRVERNHEFLRLVLPKGTPFDALTQNDVDGVLSHANSLLPPRPQRQGAVRPVRPHLRRQSPGQARDTADTRERHRPEAPAARLETRGGNTAPPRGAGA